MQAVGCQFLTKYIRTLFNKQREEVDELNLLLFGKDFESGIDFRNLISLVGHPLVSAKAFVDRKQALQIQLGFRRFLLNASNGLVNQAYNAVRTQVVRYIVGSNQQEELLRLARQNLMQTVVNTHYFIAHDTAVYHVLLAETLAPVATAFGQAIAQHHDVFAGNGRFVHELQETLVVMREIGTGSRTDGSGYRIGYEGTKTNHSLTIHRMNGID